MVGAYRFKEVEARIRAFWDERQIYAQARKRSRSRQRKFYFLDGPPYTSGKVHLGTAWNKSLKDMVIRYRRMAGYNVWDRAGYDMHGLPTEHATEKELGIAGREQIRAYGVERFIDECRRICVRNMLEMNKVFKDLGVWMDFDDAFQSITPGFMEGEWWLIKRAHEEGRLYEGERTMTWDAVNATALAKHELVYKTVTDLAIYVRLRLRDDPATSLLVWTTTPWTMPYNLAVMVNPDVMYCKVRVSFGGEEQRWIIACDLVGDLLERKLELPYVVEEEFPGERLAGVEYVHPCAAQQPVYAKLKAQMPGVHTVVMSKEYVDTSVGTGLVHCAPGCGPEDYEVGHRNGIGPFNTIDEHGVCHDIAPFSGLRAKTDDREFIRRIDEAGALVYAHEYTHEYPFGDRSKKPVIFRATKQWFLKVEDIKERLIAENNDIRWVPDAAYNAFNSWLENLRDNSISKQRFWGTPLPVWRNVADPSDYLVIGSVAELVQQAGLDAPPEDLHIPTVDKIVIRKDGKEYRRVPDVLDVWVDAGTTSWNSLGYPKDPAALEGWFPADFILEGKDQIRGWFNLLHVASMIAYGRKSFKAVYMHGFINDSQGRKMSKSEGNYIVPEEVTEKYGVDAMRYYMIGAANPGFDMNYNFEDLDAKFKNLNVFWNLHKYLIELAGANGTVPRPLPAAFGSGFGAEERYALARLQSAVRKTTAALEEYRLNEVPLLIEEFLLDLSRTYVQLVRDKATSGTDDEKQAVIDTLAASLADAMTLFAPVAPYFAEQVYLNMKEAFPELFAEESVHLRMWPVPRDDDFGTIEQDFSIAQDAISAILAARDRAQIGVRWPIGEVILESLGDARDAAIGRLHEMIRRQTNVRQLRTGTVDLAYEFLPNYKTLGREFGQRTADAVAALQSHKEQVSRMLREKGESVTIGDFEFTPSHLDITAKAPEPYALGEGRWVRAYLDTTRTPELELEGFAREITRRIQQLRKSAGLVKQDRIAVQISGEDRVAAAAAAHRESIAERTGAVSLEIVPSAAGTHRSEETIKGAAFAVAFTVR